ncbi:hypothetical protein BDF20DRAFT_1000888 [Mycotypha africana]|uniref:uncharacterized protein n=1 Tax=Mycotypha africana TaxID=64632 RepID=UPI002301B97E|nr:uncharacterized protein BDF20DRAFT_1000888 [Mycotypha africana]KAI8979621.1 hypothetical protein BDF20DRAFT_1000888 [Mycotypha africana]
MSFRLDPFPQLTKILLNSFLNARILIFTTVIAKITLDRLYKYSVIVNPLAYDADGEPTLDILEYQNPTTADSVFKALNSYGQKGRQAYLNYLFFDVIFVLARTVPFVVICTWAYEKAPERFRPGAWIPLLNAIVDLFESFMLFGVIKAFPQRNKTAEMITCYVIRFKMLTFKFTLGLMFVSLLVGVYYGFHGLLAESVVLDKGRRDRAKARDDIQEVIRQSAARRATAAAAGRSKQLDKKVL